MDGTVHLICVSLLLVNLGRACEGSVGDRSNAHQECLHRCYESSCRGKSKPSAVWRNPKFNLLVWDCESECDYSCMWRTVQLFQDHDVKIPQFYGKWPFMKLYGIQEPASAFFSVLNGAAHVYGIVQFRRRVVPLVSMYWIWHGYALVALNTWFWSTLFHIRDFTFTEKMDYICATALVTYQLFSIFARLLVSKPRRYLWLVSLLVSALCLYHVYKMMFVHFDYGYHVKVNIVVGIINALAWIGWCISVCRQRPYVWKGCSAIVLVGFCLALEVLDFPPIAWVFDAHSLWHGGTAPLTLLWYSFIIDDCRHMILQGDR